MGEEVAVRLFLSCRRALRPDFPVGGAGGAPLRLGRGPETGVKDRRVSRRHLEIRPKAEDNAVWVRNVGSNRSVVGGRALEPGEETEASVGDEVSLLEGQHSYLIKAVKERRICEVMSGLAEKENVGEKKAPTESSSQAKGSANAASASKPSGHWSTGLLSAMEDPKAIVQQDELCVVIRDKYPKAKYHYLVLPKERIKSASDLNGTHVPLLKHIHKAARHLVSEKHPGVRFRLGYHAVPSMAQLHLHAISLDFDSDCLKTKKHWNSFNTDYFVEADLLLKELEENSRVATIGGEKGKALLASPLVCKPCSYTAKSMPDLKKHLRQKDHGKK